MSAFSMLMGAVGGSTVTGSAAIKMFADLLASGQIPEDSIPPEVRARLDEYIAQHKDGACDHCGDRGSVGQLTDDEILKLKTSERFSKEIHALERQLRLAMMKEEVAKAEFWNAMHERTGIPHDAGVSVSGDTYAIKMNKAEAEKLGLTWAPIPAE